MTEPAEFLPTTPCTRMVITWDGEVIFVEPGEEPTYPEAWRE